MILTAMLHKKKHDKQSMRIFNFNLDFPDIWNGKTGVCGIPG